MSAFLGAVSFLTRVPVPQRRVEPDELARSVPYFPLVGGLVGLVVGVVYALSIFVLPSLPSAVIAVVWGLLLTGAFHEDGLADVADAFGGGRDREDVFRIMKDARLGTFGVLAVVAAFALRVAAIAELNGPTALAALPAAHALSRAGAIGLMIALPSAGEGLGASYTSGVTTARATWGLVLAIVIGTGCLAFGVLPAVVLVAIGAAVVGAMAVRKIGGVTGDVLGAAQQVGEILVLLLVAAAASSSQIDFGW